MKDCTSSPQSAAKLSSQAKWTQTLVFSTVFTTVLDSALVQPLGPLLASTFDSDAAHCVGRLSASYAGGAVLGGLMGACLLHRLPLRVSVAIFQVLLGLSLVGSAFASSLFSMHIWRFSSGFAGIVLRSLCESLLSSNSPSGHQGRSMGIVMAAIPVGTAVGLPLASMLGNIAGPQAAWLALGSLYWTSGLLLCRRQFSLIHAGTTASKTCWPERRSDSSTPINWLPILLASLNWLPAPLMLSYIGCALNSHGASALEVSGVYFAGGLLAICSMRKVGEACDRFSLQHVYCVTACSTALFLATLSAAMASGVSSQCLCFVAVALLGVAPARLVPTQAMVLRSSPGAMSKINLVVNVTMGAGALLGAWLVQGQRPLNLGAAALISVAILISCVWLGWSTSHRPSTEPIVSPEESVGSTNS